jgi:hypothetical protein
MIERVARRTAAKAARADKFGERSPDTSITGNAESDNIRAECNGMGMRGTRWFAVSNVPTALRRFKTPQRRDLVLRMRVGQSDARSCEM